MTRIPSARIPRSRDSCFRSPAWATHVFAAILLAPTLLATAACVAQSSNSHPASPPPRVRTEAGVVEGARFGTQRGNAVFRGIPYAAAPIGALRWRPSAAVHPWRGIRRAIDPGPICPQRLQPTEFYAGIATRVGGRAAAAPARKMSEDCLTLDVWTSNLGSAARLPVMVWIHGGGNNEGWGSQGIASGAPLAERGVVLVTIEYRLGVLGFLADSALDAESEHGASGNYGLLDQIAALRWVQRNIAAFGGDPTRVTIFGQSSGALDVTCLLTSPIAVGLFQRAISESGACTGPFQQLGRPVTSSGEYPPAEANGRRLAADLHLEHAPDRLAAMRAVSADAIVAAASADRGLPHEVIVDGWVVPEQPDLVFLSGRLHRVPLVIGSNADEFRTLARGFPVASLDAYPDRLLDAIGTRERMRPLLPRILAAYPAADTAEAQRRLFEANTDAFGSGARFVARAMRRAGESQVYAYYFTHVIPTPGGRALGAFHGGEIPFVFGAPPGWPTSPADDALRSSIMGYWVRFAATGDPNRSDLPLWPRYDTTTELVLDLGDPVHVLEHPRRAQYDVQDAAQSVLDSLLAR